MGQFVVENAHLKIDREKYAENYERIFGEKKEEKMSDDKYTNEMARQDTVEVCSSVYGDKIKQLEERLRDAEEVVAFYGDVESWSYPMTGIPSWEIDKTDVEESVKNYRPCIIGGKRAREYQEKYLMPENLNKAKEF